MLRILEATQMQNLVYRPYKGVGLYTTGLLVEGINSLRQPVLADLNINKEHVSALRFNICLYNSQPVQHTVTV